MRPSCRAGLHNFYLGSSMLPQARSVLMPNYSVALRHCAGVFFIDHGRTNVYCLPLSTERLGHSPPSPLPFPCSPYSFSVSHPLSPVFHPPSLVFCSCPLPLSLVLPLSSVSSSSHPPPSPQGLAHHPYSSHHCTAYQLRSTAFCDVSAVYTAW